MHSSFCALAFHSNVLDVSRGSFLFLCHGEDLGSAELVQIRVRFRQVSKIENQCARVTEHANYMLINHNGQII